MADQASGVAGEVSALGEVPKPATLAECHQVIDTLSGQLAALQQTVVVLSERLALNSRNSSKPPSSDGPGGGNRAQRRASARKRGAQKGHPGAWRELLPASEVDSVQRCTPPAQCECGGTVVVRGAPQRHQVFDLPPVIKPVVDEYKLYAGVCAGCGQVHSAVLPPGVPRGQIGARALALVGVLGTRFQMPQMKIRGMRSANPPCRPFPAAVRRSYAAAVRTVSSTGWAGACQLCGNSVAKSLFFSVGSRSKTSFR